MHQGEEPRVIQGKAQFKVYLAGLWASIPDYEFKLLNTAYNGNVAFGEWMGTGSFNGKRYGYGNIPESRKIKITGVDILLFDNNLIKEERAYYNMIDVLKQLQ